ncbi:MAG: hypothetical protein U0872_09925 [Planctomycetaceae bacterium]
MPALKRTGWRDWDWKRSAEVRFRSAASGRFVGTVLRCSLLLMALEQLTFAKTFEEHFNSPKSAWQLSKPRDKAVLDFQQRRSPEHGKDGVGEMIRAEIERDQGELRLEFPLPRAVVLDELEAALWIRSPATGIQLELRVILPEYQDPATGQTLETLVPGDVYENAGEWERLTCRTTDEQMRQRMVLLRARLKGRSLSPRQMLVDRLILKWPVHRGINELAVDELTFGPILEGESTDARLRPASGHEEPEEDPPVQFRLGQMQVEGQPFCALMIKHHGEPLKDLAELGFNVVWVRDYADQAILNSLQREKMWAAATPPIPRNASGEILSAADAGLSPFQEETRSIAFWMVGTRLSSDARSQLFSWIDQVQKADGKFRRPLAGDVAADEQVFSRELQLLGISRHFIGSSFRLSEYRDWLASRRLQAQPGSLCWTWIQVTPSRELAKVYEQYAVPDQIEPEQIRAQVYTALSAGMRSLGFWTTRRLNKDLPGDQETMLALKQLNMELRLLEPWLATTNAVTPIPVSVIVDNQPGAVRKKNGPQGPLDPPPTDAAGRARAQEFELAHRQERELTAAVLRTDTYGTLILVNWLDEQGQYVPGKLGPTKFSITVPGVPDTAKAVEITTTGMHSLDLDRRRGSGGIQLTLKQFDQTACILLTSDLELIEQTRQRIAAIQENSARTMLEAAELKLERVHAVDQKLSDYGLRQSQGPILLGKARLLLTDEARPAVSRQDWSTVRLASQKAASLARALQRSHWDSAVRSLPTPVSSPLTVSFSTLPAQAQLATRLSGNHTVDSGNLLPTGNFEDSQTLHPVGWQHEQDAQEGIRAGAGVYQEGRQSKQSLQLLAMPHGSAHPPALGDREYVRVITPAVTVHSGQVVRVAGWVKIPRALQASQDGLMIYDSVLGRSLALRYRESCNWQRFEFIREAVQSQEVTVTLALTGLGEVFLDDLEISVLTPSAVVETSGQAQPSRPRSAVKSTRWENLKRFNPLPGRSPDNND